MRREPFEDECDDDAVITARVHATIDAGGEDAFWRDAHSREHYWRAGLDYEDYAPAYCAGYIGFAQYGGSYDDAEKSLCANWLRIKGDSQLSLDEARLAMRAAWDRLAQGKHEERSRQAAGLGAALDGLRAAILPQPAFAA